MYQRTRPKPLRRIEEPFRPSGSPGPALNCHLAQRLVVSSPGMRGQIERADRRLTTPVLNGFRGTA